MYDRKNANAKEWKNERRASGIEAHASHTLCDKNNKIANVKRTHTVAHWNWKSRYEAEVKQVIKTISDLRRWEKSAHEVKSKSNEYEIMREEYTISELNKIISLDQAAE